MPSWYIITNDLIIMEQFPILVLLYFGF